MPLEYEPVQAGTSVFNADTGEVFARKINGNFERVCGALDGKATLDENGKVPAALRADTFASPVAISLEGEVLSTAGSIDGSRSVTLATSVSQIPVEKITGLVDVSGKIHAALLPTPPGGADVSNKVDKVAEATENSIATFTADGGIQDSGVHLVNKADLIDGKIPVSQIPALSADAVDETAGRKYVSEQQIAKWDNKADLAQGKVPPSQLPDPAVGSVFGRAGAVTAQPGDYNAGQITETEGRKFVTPAQVAAWDGKADKGDVLGRSNYIHRALFYHKEDMAGGETLSHITKEHHSFTYNVVGTPGSDYRYGFLDVGYFDGEAFIPGKVTYQRFIDWATGTPYYRTHFNGAWGPWLEVSTEANTGKPVDLTLLNGWALQWGAHATAYRVGKMVLFNIGPIAGGVVAGAGPICNLEAAFGVKLSDGSFYCVATDWTGQKPSSACVANGHVVQDHAAGYLPWTAGHTYIITGMATIV